MMYQQVDLPVEQDGREIGSATVLISTVMDGAIVAYIVEARRNVDAVDISVKDLQAAIEAAATSVVGSAAAESYGVRLWLVSKGLCNTIKLNFEVKRDTLP